MNNSENKLLPCPFCGGKARISADPDAIKDSQGRKWAFTVVCDKCASTSGLTFSPERAIEAWNNRKPIERIVERLEESSHWTMQTFDDDGYGNDDSEEVISLQTAIDIVNEQGKIDLEISE